MAPEIRECVHPVPIANAQGCTIVAAMALKAALIWISPSDVLTPNTFRQALSEGALVSLVRAGAINVTPFHTVFPYSWGSYHNNP